MRIISFVFLYLLLNIFIKIDGKAQSCDGADGLFPPLSGNTVIANGDICANTAILPYRWEITYTNVDDGGNPNNVQFFIDWDDGTTQVVSLGVGDNTIDQYAPNSYRAIVTHFFPPNGNNVQCEYVPVVFLQVDGVQCPSTSQNPSPVIRWNTDEENTGELELSENGTGNVIYEVCAGETATVSFIDRSEFNCVPANFPGFPPNIRRRWFQFIYGGDPINNTITGTGISINTNTGSNPEGGGIVFVPTGTDYVSQVVERPQPIDAPTEFTFDITVPADAQIGEEFAITLNNWNECNKYLNGGLPTGNLPVQFTALIRIIDSPLEPNYTPLDYCVNDPISLTVTPNNAGTITWYSDPAATNQIFIGPTTDPTSDFPAANQIDNSVPGIYSFYATETLGNNCEGPPVLVEFEVYDETTPSQAGIDQVVCDTEATLQGNTPIVGTGTWTKVSGPGVITDPTSPTSTVTGISPANPTILRWTIVNGPCSSSDDVSISVDQTPGPADAGTDQFACNITGTFLSATSPTVGTGTWTQVSGPAATIVDDLDPNSQVTGLIGDNVYTFRWTIDNGVCAPIFDEVNITTDLDPPANAGPDLSVCPPLTSLFLQGTQPPIGSGVWNVVSGPGTVTDINSATSEVTGITSETILEWTVTNGVCVDVDQVVISVDIAPDVAAVGIDQAICSDSYTMTGNVPGPGAGTGTWTLISGAATIIDPNDPATLIEDLQQGPNVFRYTISNACGSTFDELTITNNLADAALAGLDQTVCGNSTVLSANTPNIGTGTWTITTNDGFGALSNPLDPQSGFQGSYDFNYELTWSVGNGLCPANVDQVEVLFNEDPLPASAGSDQVICGPTTNLAAVPASAGSGLWAITSGDGNGLIGNTSNPTSNFTGTPGQTYVLEWSVSNGVCAPTTDAVVIQLDQEPSDAIAGLDQVICGGSTTLDATAVVIGQGSWSENSGDGNGSFSDINDPQADFTGSPGVTYELIWLTSNGVCATKQDAVTIELQQDPSDANAGPDQEVCGSSTSLQANNPPVGAGLWSIISGDGMGSFVSTSDNGTVFSGTAGQTYELRWTTSNGTCADKFDEVIIRFYRDPTPATAGPDQVVCGNSTELEGNTPLVGTGLWTVNNNPDGLGIVVNPNDPQSDFIGTPGITYELRWVTSNGVCDDTEDEVEIILQEEPSIAEAGNDQIICVNTTSLQAVAPSVGNGQWSFIDAGDGNGVINNINDPQSDFSGSFGETYILQWTISNGICPVSADQVTIEIGPELLPAVINGTSNVCVGQVATYTVPGGNPAIYEYQWDLSDLPVDTDIITGSGSPFQFISLEFNTAGGGDLRLQIIERNTGCAGPISTFPIAITDIPDMTLTSSDADLTICAGDEVTFTATDNNGIATEFEFILNGSTVQTGPSATYTTSSLTVGNTMTVRGISGGCPSALSNVLTHTVNPLPVPFALQGGGEICQGEPGIELSMSSSEAGISYELLLNGNPTGVTRVGSGGAISFTPQTVSGTYTVQANSPFGCGTIMPGSREIIVNPLPQIFDLTGGGQFCPGDAGLNLELSGSELGVSYQVLLNGSPFQTPIAGTGNPLSIGPFQNIGTYQIVAETPENCEAQMNGSVDVSFNAVPNLQAVNNNPEICSGETTNIVLRSNLGTSTFSWTVDFDPLQISGAENSLIPVNEDFVIAQSLTNLTSQPVTVTYRITPQEVCTGDEQLISVIINPLPTATITGSSTICSGEDVNINLALTGSLPFSITYNDGTSDIVLAGQGANPVISLSPSQTTEYTLVSVTDGKGCTSPIVGQSATITVIDPSADFVVLGDPIGCSPSEITFENLALEPNVTYEWSWGDGTEKTVSNSQFVTHTFENNSTTLTRTYSVVLTALYDDGNITCSEVGVEDVQVFPTVRIDIEPDVEQGCAPLTVNFSNLSSGVTVHDWYFRTLGSSEIRDRISSPQPSFIMPNTTADPIIYEVVYTGGNANCEETVFTEITVWPEVSADFTVNGSLSPNAVLQADEPHAVIATTIPNFAGWTYEWDYGDGNTSTGYDPLPNYVYSNAGEYLISFTVTDASGNCTAQEVIPIRVEPVTPVIDFTATPLSGCRPLIVQFNNLSTGVDPSTYRWEFYDQSGVLVGTSVLENPEFTFYDAGLYTIYLFGENVLGEQTSTVRTDYVEVYDVPTASFQVRPNTLFLPGGILYTQNLSIGAVDYLWDFGDDTTYDTFEPEHEYTRSGDFTVQLIATNRNGCTDTLTRANLVEVIEGGNLRIPNAFSPSLNGPTGGRAAPGTFNDVFLPIIDGATEFHMQIFDRWGHLLFESRNKEIGWDGYDERGKLMPTGVYVYKLRVRFSNRELYEKIGDVTLIR